WGTFRADRNLFGGLALAGLALAGAALAWSANETYETEAGRRAAGYAGPVLNDALAVLIKGIALGGRARLGLSSWDQAADYHAGLLIILAGVCLTGAANDLVTMFLALELISIPTYVMLYLPKHDTPAQEAALKYFLLSVFSSALLLFGFSYLYGLAGT